MVKKGHYISVKFKKKEIAVPLPGSDSIFNVPKLGLGLGSALGKSPVRRDNLVRLGGANDNLNLWNPVSSVSEYARRESYLDRAVVNKQAVQLLESPASTIRLVEDDVGDATALRVGAVGQLNALDGANRLNKVFLFRRSVVS